MQSKESSLRLSAEPFFAALLNCQLFLPVQSLLRLPSTRERPLRSYKAGTRAAQEICGQEL